MGKPLQSKDLKGKLEIHPASLELCDEVAMFMREADLAEVRAHGYGALEGIWMACMQSEQSYVASWEGEPFFVFGISDHSDGSGFIWAVGTDFVQDIAPIFARESRRWVEALGEDYPLLWTNSFTKNVLHHRWLEWCGFTHEGSTTMGPYDARFETYCRITP
jgi:hypothetical protein